MWASAIDIDRYNQLSLIILPTKICAPDVNMLEKKFLLF